MIPYGGPVYRPPVQRVDPPSKREISANRRFALLVVLWVAASLALASGLGADPGYREPGPFILSGLLYAAWYAVKIKWKKD